MKKIKFRKTKKGKYKIYCLKIIWFKFQICKFKKYLDITFNFNNWDK